MTKKHNFATLLPISIPYTLTNGNTILLTSLSNSTYYNIINTYNNYKNTLKIQLITQSISNFTTNDILDINDIDYNEIDKILNKVIEITIPPLTIYDKINTAIKVLQENKWKSKDFTSCKICQEKKLDIKRNCPLLPKETHSKSIIYTFDNDNKFILKDCPMYYTNRLSVLPDVLSLLNMLEFGFLPTNKGFLEQTVFVVEVSKILKHIIEKKRQIPFIH